MNINLELSKIFTLTQRDLLKFFRDKTRLIGALIFPTIFIGVFGATLDAGIGSRIAIGYSFIDYIFAGILIQTVFQSAFSGIVSLIRDREEDFAMSLFVAPVSRYSIVLGKVIGEALIGFMQVFGIIAIGYLIGVRVDFGNVLLTLPFCLVAGFAGASLGILISSRFSTSDAAQRVLPLLMFPLIFLSGAFTPVNDLPIILEILKLINPLSYGVDLARHIIFAGEPSEILEVVAPSNFYLDIFLFSFLGLVFFTVGTYLFANKEGNK
jgi:ABC-2 type transport system permease protein